ncbi:MAG TPA: M1 family aminopeptidase [Pyrinomonadaceae bacterium]|nr:M1 family aminopeptidase [Pyrinomonadaceae bacterium]
MFRTKLLSLIGSALAVVAFASAANAQQPAVAGTRFDITNYRIEVQLQPDDHTLRAGADVTLTPLEATRSVVFELNGSLKVNAVEKDGRVLPGVVQDPVGAGALGPNVRIDLGEVVPAGQPVTLRIRWSGALISPEGGPLASKRLAYVGTEGSYLMYAARWFPFHDYMADRATSDITVIVPTGVQVGGISDEPVNPQVDKSGTTRFRFVQKTPQLVGNFVAGQFITKSLRFGRYEVQFFVKPGSENRITPFGELMGRALDFYTKQYGTPAFGTRMIVAQTDDEAFEAYSGLGLLFLASKFFEGRTTPEDRLQREIAYQWWGQTVGLKSFDDAWVSQGLAEWSAFAFRQSILTGAQLDAAQREEQERALTFEQTSSIARAPASLDDQSAAYQSIVFYKGAMVFSMLRETLGPAKFEELLARFVEQFRNKNASVDDFERLTSQVAGRNMRYFFAQWLEGTGVPEFSVDYQIIRTRSGKFRTRGTVRQNFENLNMPVELTLRSEGGDAQTKKLVFAGRSEDFDFESGGQPIAAEVDPNNKILRMSDDLKVSIVARRGIELFKEGQYAEAQQQMESALKLDRNNAWVYYNLALIYFEQKNWQLALDNFQAAIDSTSSKPTWIDAWAHIRRGNAYDAKGDRNKAVFEYNKALQTGSNYDNAQAAAKKFIETPFDPKTPAETVQAAPGSE